jgi:acetolactate decarboxylase
MSRNLVCGPGRCGVHALAALAALFAAGCAAPPNPLQDVVTQFSTTGYLQQHAGDPQVAITNLPAYGDIGVAVDAGTGRALAWFDGHCYRVSPAAGDQGASSAAWAAVTFFETNLLFDVGDMNEKVFQRTMDWKRVASNDVSAVRVEGAFRSVTLLESPLHSASDTNAPPPVTLTVLSGTMVGFRSPAFLGGVLPGGYYFHFVDSERQRGGCVLRFDLAQGRVILDGAGRLQVMLPTETSARVP